MWHTLCFSDCSHFMQSWAKSCGTLARVYQLIDLSLELAMGIIVMAQTHEIHWCLSSSVREVREIDSISMIFFWQKKGIFFFSHFSFFWGKSLYFPKISFTQHWKFRKKKKKKKKSPIPLNANHHRVERNGWN